MLYITKIEDFLKVLPDDKVEDFVVKDVSEHFKYTKDILCSKLNEEQILEKLLNLKSLLIFVHHLDLYFLQLELLVTNLRSF